MAAAGIPTADYGAFTDLAPALAWARGRGGQVVVKADGLAAGKGVVVCGSVDEAEQALRDILVDRVHGGAGARVVVEERLTGPEASCIGITDGQAVRMLPAAQDHKRIFDRRPRPQHRRHGRLLPHAQGGRRRARRGPAHRARAGGARDGAARPPLPRRPLRRPHADARGPRVLEFNARLGDPETQPILMRVASDLVPLLLASARGDLGGVPLTIDPARRRRRGPGGRGLPGPGHHRRRDPRRRRPRGRAGVQVFHAATRLDEAGRLVTAGGRVLTVCALGDGLADAARRAYGAVQRLDFRGMQYRRDIGASA